MVHRPEFTTEVIYQIFTRDRRCVISPQLRDKSQQSSEVYVRGWPTPLINALSSASSRDLHRNLRPAGSLTTATLPPLPLLRGAIDLPAVYPGSSSMAPGDPVQMWRSTEWQCVSRLGRTTTQKTVTARRSARTVGGLVRALPVATVGSPCESSARLTDSRVPP